MPGTSGRPTGRRDFLKLAGGSLAALALSACGGSAAPAPASAGPASASPSGAAAAPSRVAEASPSAAAKPAQSAASPASSGGAPSAQASAGQAQTAGGDPKGDRLSVSYASPALSDLPFYAALSQGLFTEQHIYVTMVKLPSPAVPAALTKGDVDFTNQPSAALAGASKGLPLKTVLQLWKEAPWAVVGKPELKSLNDLKGKIVATTATGSSPYLYLQAALKKIGMDMRSDVKVVSTRGTEDSYAFLIGGQADAVVLSPPFDAQAETKGFSRVADIGSALQIPYTGLGTTAPFIASHRPQVIALIRSLLDANRWLQAHAAAAADLAVEHIGVTPDVAKRAIDHVLPMLSDTGEGPLEGIKQALDAQAQFSNDPVTITPEQAVDYGPLHEALAARR